MSLVVLFWYAAAACSIFTSGFGVQAQPATYPSEVIALNAIVQKWNLTVNTKQWNTTGDPCSGVAIDEDDETGYFYDANDYNPFIKCNCSFDSNTTCHITQLKASILDIVAPIPDELYSLTFLQYLNLEKNYLTGPISPSVGNLSRITYLNLGHNDLSGEIPKDIVKLTNLTFLALGTLNLSGSLPPEIGYLTTIQKIFIDNSGLSGEIPPTFANLTNMIQFWATDTNLTGRIPDFIGNWTKLTTLRFQGNSFEGSIPSSLSRLTLLTELRITDVTISNDNSSLGFIKDMLSLDVLMLRNNNISDSIPSNIGDYRKLVHLDLSFNNLHGQIPATLFDMNVLAILFLGNNKLNGSLPESKSSALLVVDVSYNNLVGQSFPSWVNEQNLQLNLVANNFTIGSSDSSDLPSGLNCLQRGFPCHRDSPVYYNFMINCGGDQTKISNGTVYEKDNEPLGPATYYVTDTNRWGVSNVGLKTQFKAASYLTGTDTPMYTISTSSPIKNTSDPTIFQSARISASSLRYYGLGLENGNYTVKLEFAEQAILDTSRKSLGRRVFDIYIQDVRVVKDFDLRKETNRTSLVAIEKVYKAQVVSENYLEIHFFWAGKGTCCIPEEGTYGPLISAISATPEFKPTVSNKLPSVKKNRTGMIVGIVVGGGVLFLVVVLFYIVQRRKRLNADDNYDEELLGIDLGPLTFSYSELKAATNDFSPDNKLGEGGFGPVFKGTLSDGRVIAVKQLSASSHQGKNQFVTEIATISSVRHNNLVNLYGFCAEGSKRLLVYEYLENRSLDQALFGKRTLHLDWPTRFDICLGVARGLTYLHEESRHRIVHRDVKASNILLDSNLVAKISDFGLAKHYDDKMTHMSTRVAGTIGYLAPEYAMRGHLTEKTDVFAYGVVILEIVSGRSNSDPSLKGDMVYLLELAWNLHENKRELDLVDSRLSEFNEVEARRIINIGLLCTQSSPNLRPAMSRVSGMLTGDIEVTPATSKPSYLTDWKFDDVTTITSQTKFGDGSTGTSLATDGSARGTDFSFLNSSAGTSVMGDAGQLPSNATLPIFSTNGDDGR
ncbi:probable LRR receptor-like serine/threonine-protein kinase At1g56130 [Argentina anserina]|uniref:probable LRR receptor-like serine/threonine-protein kinase At1g56130 n=1 Tax=Argentina anserina TaxID=57926 RepID=UPI0021765FCD|nr:probable LRR receptor-like serine/threonine-protein kinase At1g56130 [Potentilla anserina]